MLCRRALELSPWRPCGGAEHSCRPVAYGARPLIRHGDHGGEECKIISGDDIIGDRGYLYLSQTSGELMEAVRALDYKAQYKVCEAFYKLSKGFDWSDRLMFQRFEESFSMIDAENLEENFVELHWAVNDMDSFLYETDVYSPEEFYKVVREMEKDIVFQP